MARINPQAINELRERTSAGMSDCKAALIETDGDLEKAIQVLLRKGLAKSSKKSGTHPTEGVLLASTDADKRQTSMVEVNCQADSMISNPLFQQFANDVLQAVTQTPLKADLSFLTIQGKMIGEIASNLSKELGQPVAASHYSYR